MVINMNIKKILCLIIIVVAMLIPVHGYYDSTLNRVIDNANLLTDGEENSLRIYIDEIINTYEFDVVILTTDSCEGKSVVEYADDYFDYNGYGYGDEYDGILFLLSMEERDWYFSTCGYGIYVFTDYGIQRLGNSILSYLSGGEYYDAFNEFLYHVEDYITQANDGNPYDVYISDYEYDYNYDYDYEYTYTTTDDRILYLGIALLASVVIALIIVLIMKYKMNTLRSQHNAHDYIKRDSLVLFVKNDLFLHSNIKKTRRDTDSSSGGKSGGSSTHTSSSGRSHGGGGGKF